jgi:predicted TIM-barrel fold metal-dependent hydrolase
VTPVIDIHIHIQPLGMLKPAVLEFTSRSHHDFAQIEKFSADPAAFLKYLDESGVERAGLICSVSPEVIGYTSEVCDWNARYCSASPKRLIAFGSVHPRYVADAGAEVDRLVKIGIQALKIHPPHQLFSPNAYRDGLGPLAAVYERAQTIGLPVMIHTGTSIFPGARNVYAQPILADDVAVDYPDLVIILAHGGRPLWMDEAFFLVRRHKNMYMDISSIPPQKLLLEYFPRLEEIADKVLFGTDWPGFGVRDIGENIAKFKALPLSEAAQRKILYDNAARLFPWSG